MTLAVVKEQLHDYVDQADAKKAKALLKLIEHGLTEHEYVFDEETLNMLNERLDSYLSGAAKGYTIAESMDRINSHRGAEETSLLF